MTDPELFLFDPSDLPGASEYRAERARLHAESRSRYRAVVETALAATTDGDGNAAEGILRGLFEHRQSDGTTCHCSCHPRLPDGDLHDHGFDCPCQQTPEQREAAVREWLTSTDAFWTSPEGLRLTAAQEAEAAELAVWVADDPRVIVESHGGWAPEQWRGFVDGRSFYFRERHGDWRIELDLQPTGRLVKVWKGGDPDDDDNIAQHEISEGDVIAEGTVGDDGYGRTPAERIRFIVSAIDTYLCRESCSVHRDGRADLARRLGAPPAWCPNCGARLT